MDFLTAVKTCFNKYADASGRAGRSEFWYFWLFSVLVSWAVSIIDVNIIEDLVWLAFLVPSICVGIRRMHDIGKSGWFILIPIYDIYLALKPSQPGANAWGTTYQP